MHRIADRPVEALTFDLQPEVARRMGWRGRGDEPAVERFMRRYFLVARDVGALTRAMSAQLEARQQKKAGGLVRGLSALWSGRGKPLETPGFLVDKGRLSVTGPEVFDEDPTRLLTLFVEADRLDLDLHPDAFAAVTRSLPRVTPRLRRDPEASRAFLTVLAHGQRPYRVLSIMNETGLLGRFLPEWGRIVGQTQFNMYHAYTVDEHTLQAVGIINDIKRGKLKDDHPLASEIIHRITDPEVLMLAMLLHDVGKGGDRGQLEDGAIAARRACERLGVDSRRIELVTWLVRHHLALSDYAQKRDVTDPDTVQACADLVGDPERLRMLLVLTAADIRAVGPGVWNNWKGQLLRDLHRRVLAVFKGETVDEPDPLAAYPELVARARETGAAADVLVDWAADPAAERHPRAVGRATTRVAVAAADRPGLFAALAQALSRAGADIVGARVVTAPEGLALDVFEVQDGAGLPYGQAEPRRLERLIRSLEAAARAVPEGTPDVPEEETVMTAVSARRAAFDVRPVVMIDTTAASQAVVIEVSGAGRACWPSWPPPSPPRGCRCDPPTSPISASGRSMPFTSPMRRAESRPGGPGWTGWRRRWRRCWTGRACPIRHPVSAPSPRCGPACAMCQTLDGSAADRLTLEGEKRLAAAVRQGEQTVELRAAEAPFFARRLDFDDAAGPGEDKG